MNFDWTSQCGTLNASQGDCLELMTGIPDGSVDMVLTDIPYGQVNRDSNGLRNLNKGAADIETFPLEPAMSEAVRVCRGSLYVFCATEQVSIIRSMFVSHGLSTRLCVWEKTNPSPMNGQHMWLSSIECCVYAKRKGAVFNEHCQSSVWRNPCARGKLHPTMKPTSLMERLISASSNAGETVLDFTMGSGTTGVAAKNLNRRFIGFELDPDYFKAATERMESVSSGPLQSSLFAECELT